MSQLGQNTVDWASAKALAISKNYDERANYALLGEMRSSCGCVAAACVRIYRSSGCDTGISG